MWGALAGGLHACLPVCAAAGAGPNELWCVQIVFRLLTAVDQKIKDSAAEREERRKFEINYEGEIPVGSATPITVSKAEEEPKQQPEP